MFCNPGAIRRSRLGLGAAATGCFIFLSLLDVSKAQVPSAITPDGTLGTVVTSRDRGFTITGGRRPDQGPNLFHSFGQFDVGTGATAHFVGQPGIEHIIGRVTGGSASQIDGRLQSDASLFLLNPHGLMFGPHATLDVRGAFHASTADALRFADGTAFSARLNEKSTVTVASPAAFGFLSEVPTGIALKDSDLTVPEGETLSIVGGHIEMTGGTLKAPSGRVTIASVASAGNAIWHHAAPSADIDVDSFARLGGIRISQTGRLDATGAHGGRVILRGGHLMLDNALILTNMIKETGDHEVGIDIELSGDMLLTNEGIIDTFAQGDQDAADIRITTHDLHMSGFSRIVSETSSRGRAGHVTVGTANVTLLEGSQLNSLTFGPGDAGAVSVRATGTVTLRGVSKSGNYSSGIFANSQGIGAVAGAAGSVEVEAANVTLANGAAIGSSAFGLGTGRAGSITIVATDVQVAGEKTRISAETRGAGASGSIRIETNRLEITEAAQISTTTRGPGPGGTLIVIARESIDIVDAQHGFLRSGLFSNSGGVAETAGHAGDIVIRAPRLTVEGGRILSRTLGDGDAGDMLLEVGRLELLGGAQIFNGIGIVQGNGVILGNPDGTGQGGHLRVEATEAVVITGKDRAGFSSGLFSNAQIGHGRAGNISLSTPVLMLNAGGQIATLTLDSGSGGTVAIVAPSAISITGRHVDGTPSGIFSSASASGEGGDIRLHARHVQLGDGASISAASSGVGNAGSIRIAGAHTLLLSGNSDITTEANQASGGNIEIATQSLARLRDSAITATVRGGPESVGGNIAIDPEFVILENSQIISNANQGRGGDIQIEAGVFLADPASIVSAIALDSQVGIDGEVNVEAVTTNLSDVVTPLPPDFASAASLLRDRCTAQLQEGTVSSLMARGRPSVPMTPEGILPSRLYAPEHTEAIRSETKGL